MSQRPLLQLLRLELAVVGSANFRFFHCPTVYAFLHACAGSKKTGGRFPRGARLLACESGRVSYERNGLYHVGLALTRDTELSAQQWAHALQGSGSLSGVGRAPLGAGTRLVRAFDLVSRQGLGPRAHAAWLDASYLDGRAAALASVTNLRVRFDSPLLILRTPVTRRDTFLDERVFLPEVFFARVGRAVAEAFPEYAPEGAGPGCSVLANALVRAETHYHGAGGVKVLPGALGEVELALAEPLNLEWARTLLLAGVLGVGKNTDMGQGRFTLLGHPLHPDWPPPPARTFCQRMADDRILELARDGITQGGPTPGIDEIGRLAFLDALTLRRPVLAEAIADGSYRGAPLRGLLLSKPSGGVRPLALPTMEDRFVQRACVETLAPAFDELLEECSFGYRRGLSRRSAELSVRQAHDQGFKYVLEGDLRAFFDTVDWSVLQSRLRAYLGADPLVEVMMSWVSAPVHYADREIARQRGLPQGAVVSPLLANLYLDPFDEGITAHGFRLVRYADDFVVLCRSAADIGRARAAVEEELERLRLRLAEEKTKASSFDQGFEFLGYLFCKSVSLEKRKDRSASPSLMLEGASTVEELRELGAEQAEGWVRDLLELAPSTPDWAAGATRQWRTTVAPNAPERRSLYLVSPGLRLSGSRRGLRIFKAETLLAEHAWSTLSEVVVLGGHYVTANTFQQALKHRVPIAMYTRNAVALGLVLPERVRSPSPMTRQHWRWQQNEGEPLKIARSLIEAKLHNHRLLARYQPGDNDRLREQLLSASRAAGRAESAARLRGIEGQAAHAYFASWQGWLPENVHFPGRTGRGARDPVNAVLNLLYTNLFRLCWLGLINQGLDPYLGVLHDGGDRYAALAADMQEPFRFLCDRLALELFHRGTLTQADFQYAEKAQVPYRIKTDALKRVLSEWEARLDAKVKVGDRAVSYRTHLMDQCSRFADVVAGRRADVAAFRLKW